MLDYIINKTKEYLNGMPKTKRKKIGQFFTGLETARFMASLFSLPQKEHLDILDPGAGSAILTVALMERLEQEGNVNSVSLICYETEPAILDLLKENLEYIKSMVTFELDYKIIAENYITSQQLPLAFADLVIGNPPYLKINRLAEEATMMKHVVYGAPNLYFLFATRSIENLREGGELVYIIPRSWTSGAYFKVFRNFLFKKTTIEHIHLFVSRDKVFEHEAVLQETMIIKLKKQVGTAKDIVISSTESSSDFNNIQYITVPKKLVVGNDDNQYVYLVTNNEEVDVLKRLSVFHNTLLSLDMKMKTGLTVDFREREHLMDEPTKDNVPMFFAQHLHDGRITFPIGKHGEYLDTRKSGLLQTNTNYLFVKRFTSKEETRRLQSSIYLQEDFPNYKQISTQNKLNFIARNKKELTKPMVYGLYCLFNSTLYDKYYRILNGSTQVNSTEVNTMPMPTLDGVVHLGEQLIKANDLSERSCDGILEEYLNDEDRRSEKVS